MLTKQKYSILSLLVWSGFTLIIISMTLLNHANRSVLYQYIGAANAWVGGLPLYTTDGRGFLYFPQAAVFFIPFSIMHAPVAELSWRVLSICFYAYALHKWLCLSRFNSPRFFFFLSLLVIPIAFSSARNGQMNLVLAAIMLLSVTVASQNRWWLTATLLILGLSLKPTMIVLLLLMVGVYPALWWRVFCLGLVFFAIPLLTNPIAYVIHQYRSCFDMLFAAASLGNQRSTWAQIFSPFGLLHHPIPATLQNIIRIFTAILTLFISYLAKQRLTSRDFAIFLFALSATYLMLFNPRTENNDYAIIAPAVVYLWAYNVLILKHKFLSVMMSIIAIGIMFSHPLGMLLTQHGTWIAPLMTLGSAIILLYEQSLYPLFEQKTLCR